MILTTEARPIKWHDPKVILPPIGKYIVGKYWPYYGDGTLNWQDSTDQENVNTVIVKRVESNGINRNNLTEYEWEGFGPSKFLGQEIIAWIPIPKQL